jgi:hypothetical protein
MRVSDSTPSARRTWSGTSASPGGVRDALLGLAESLGSNVLLVQFNQGAMPHEMFLRQIERSAEEVLPAIQRYDVTRMLAT